MKYVSILAILIFFSTLLDASSYARSIRVGSFLKEKHAEKELVRLEEFVQSNSRLNQLQNRYHFKVKLIVRGRYYLNVIEPLMVKPVVQEILDILRTKYSYVYPKKIRYLPEYEHYGEDEEQEVIEQKEESIDDLELMKKVDKILQSGKIKETEAPITTKVVDRTKYLPTMEVAEEESSFFDIFNVFHIDENSSLLNIFSDSEEETKEIKPKQEEKRVIQVEEVKDSSNSTLDTITDYTLETLLAIAIMILLVLLRLYIKYKKESQNKISMQDIYS